MLSKDLSFSRGPSVKPYMQNEERRPTGQGCHPKKEQILGAMLEHQLHTGWCNPWMPHRDISARRAAGVGMITADRSVPFCPDQNGEKPECSQGTVTRAITGLVKMDPRGSSASLQREC